MIRCRLILFLCLVATGNCFAQPDDQKNRTAQVRSNNTQNTYSRNGGNGDAPKNSAAIFKPELNVLFATNEPCDLYINEELKGQIFKTEFLYLKIAPGKYSYKAVSKATNDELKDSFSVREEGNNEIFIDLLYVVDEKNAQRESLKKTKAVSTGPVVITEKKSATVQPIIQTKLSNKDAVQAVINLLTGNMVLIEGGKFTMGNNRALVADEAEHPVTINPLFFSRYEVTQHQWKTIMGYNPSMNKNCSICPVENVSWGEVIQFIQKLNNFSNEKFRLPTEAEWEFVARMGGKAEIDAAGGQEKYINKTAWYFGNADKKTHPVGILQPNAAGVFDLMGNVSEWCIDWYGTYSNKESSNHLNSESPQSGKEKIIRGGNFKDFQGDRFRPSFRNKRAPIEKSSEVGFRLVLETRN